MWDKSKGIKIVPGSRVAPKILKKQLGVADSAGRMIDSGKRLLELIK
jgi:hypothetical protein